MPGSTRRFPFLIPVPRNVRTLRATVSSAGSELGSVQIELRQLATTSRIIAGISSELSLDSLSALGSAGAVRVVYPRLDDLPQSWAGYDGVDAVIVHDTSFQQLRSDQVAALEGWVATGGALVFTGGAAALQHAPRTRPPAARGDHRSYREGRDRRGTRRRRGPAARPGTGRDCRLAADAGTHRCRGRPPSTRRSEPAGSGIDLVPRLRPDNGVLRLVGRGARLLADAPGRRQAADHGRRGPFRDGRSLDQPGSSPPLPFRIPPSPPSSPSSPRTSRSSRRFSWAVPGGG